MNKSKKSSNKAGYFPILMCFIMISSGLCIFPTVGEYTSGYQDYIEDIEYQGDDTLPIDMNFKGEDTNENAELIEINLQDESEIISTNIPPVADAGPDITLNVGPHAFMYSVPFNGSGSYDLDGIIIDYLWDFGDGNTSQGEFRIHFYASPGNYTVTLMVTDDFGANNTDTMVVTLIEMPAWTVTTDKYTYLISEPVVIFFWGVMSLPALGDHWYKIEDENGNLVVDNSFMGRASAIQMVSDPYTEIWDQAYYGVPQHGQQIPTGKYYVWFGWTQKQFGPAEFEIINSSDDLTEPLKVTTDKYTYYIGEPVHITITGYRVGSSTQLSRGYFIKDEFGDWVRDRPQKITFDIVPSWGPDNYTWQQQYDILHENDFSGNPQKYYPNNGEQVSLGKYYIYPHPGDCEPAEIEIIERPGLKIEKEKISGPYEVLTYTYHEWELKITVSGASLNKIYENVVVYDVLPAELELLEYELTQGTLTVTKKGKGKMGATHLLWDVGNLENEAELIIKITTRKNPAGKQEFTSPGTYFLNEGAWLKFFDDSTQENIEKGPTDPILVIVLEG